MEATTSPQDYRRFDDAQAIEFYAEPARVPGPLVLSPTSNWGELSKASAMGGREPMEGVASRLRYPDAERIGLPSIHLDFVYTGSVAAPLFEECYKFDETANSLIMRLWRFRLTGRGEPIECCFRAVLPSLMFSHTAGQQGKIFGTFTVLDAQPFIEEV